MSIAITPYDPAFDPSIACLENGIVQGEGIQLRILKDHFLDRSVVFSKTFPLLAINEAQEVVGTSIGAEATMMINDETYNAGFVFDAKVHAAYRNKGIGRKLAAEQKSRFIQQGWQKNFTTLKASNTPVIKLSAKAIANTWLTHFVYLTIPTNISIRKGFPPQDTTRFSIRLFDQEKLSADYYTMFSGGLGCFHTWRLYRLKIERMGWIYQQGIHLLKKINPQRYSCLPNDQEIIEFATLFNHTAENIETINEVLQHLSERGKRYLLVCCGKHSSLYQYLKVYAINTYSYYLLTDFSLSKKDAVAIDVRCL